MTGIKYEVIADHYGLQSQLDMFVEESAELTQAICKSRRAKDETSYNEACKNIKEELADVIVIVEQLKYLLGADEINRVIDEKVRRQLGRIREEITKMNEIHELAAEFAAGQARSEDEAFECALKRDFKRPTQDELDQAFRQGIETAKEIIADLEGKHHNECAQIAHYDNDLKNSIGDVENDKSAKIEELCEKMNECATATSDIERAHVRADDILCEALKLLGCPELVELYAKVDKWYA